MLTADKKRAFGAWFWLSAALMLLTYCFGALPMLLNGDGNALEVFLIGDLLVPTRIVTPLVAALPFATAFAADAASGMSVYMLIRSGRRRFLGSKLIGSLLSGGLVLALATAAYIGVLNLRLGHDYARYAPMIAEACFYPFDGAWTLGSFAAYYGISVFVQFLAGMFWASVALAFSAFQPNLSLSLVAPPVLYRLFQALADFMPARFSPYMLQNLTPLLTPWEIVGYSLIVFVALTAVTSAIFLIKADRRIQNL